MRLLWYGSLVAGFVVGAALLASCDRGSCGAAALTAGDICPPPTYGYARVTGTALQSDGSPIAGKEARVGCGDVVGGYSDATDAAGRFNMAMFYSVGDTVLFPFPPRRPDGSFDVNCIVFLELSSNVMLKQEQVPVRFTPAEADIVPTVVELRETSE